MKFQIQQINKIKVARFSIIIIFLALIRMISEVFRLEHYSVTTLTYEQIKPFIGSLVAAIALFIMTLLSFYSKHKPVIVLAALTIIVLLVIKRTML